MIADVFIQKNVQTDIILAVTPIGEINIWGVMRPNEREATIPWLMEFHSLIDCITFLEMIESIVLTS